MTVFNSRVPFWMLAAMILVPGLSAQEPPAGSSAYATTQAADPGGVRQQLREPLPIEVAASVKMFWDYELSPDGEWAAYVYQGADDGKQHLRLFELKTGRTVEPAVPAAASRAPAWSPDGSMLAFYSDESGEPLVWIWRRTSRRARPLIEARVQSVLEAVQLSWLPNGRELVARLWPEGEPRPAATGLTELEKEFYEASKLRFEKVRPEEPSYIVHRAGLTQGSSRQGGPANDAEAMAANVPVSNVCGRYVGDCDLGLVNVEDGSVRQLARRVRIDSYKPSPDGRYIAYTGHAGGVPNTQQNLFDLTVVEIATGRETTLTSEFYATFGDIFSWSPDSRQLAYAAQGQAADGILSVVSLDDLDVRRLEDASLPKFNTYNGLAPVVSERAPIWSIESDRLYAVSAEAELWEVDVTSGHGRAVGPVPGRMIRGVMVPRDQPVLWARKGGRKVWVATTNADQSRDGIYEIDLTAGSSRKVVEIDGSITPHYAASRGGDVLIYSTSDPYGSAALWRLDTGTGEIGQIVDLNQELRRYALGDGRVIRWKDNDGRELGGALLLPPGYEPGERVPMVMVIYGGAMGSEGLGQLGRGAAPVWNMHLLATRGYAVLYPDAPTRVGQTLQDIYRSAMLAADGAVEQGFADPDRLAIMGASYGSYSALCVITQTTRFRAAEISGVMSPDLLTGYLGAEPGGNAMMAYFESGQGKMGGSPWEYPERYRGNSPIMEFDEIETPILMIQGDADPATPISRCQSGIQCTTKAGQARGISYI